MDDTVLHVQIAEDSPRIRDLLLDQLAHLPGVRVTAASRTAEEALRCLREAPPDLLVLDLQLEQSSALDVMRELRSAARRPCVAVLTNHADPETREACEAAGASYFFDKSADFDRFLETVRALARARTVHPADPVDSGSL